MKKLILFASVFLAIIALAGTASAAEHVFTIGGPEVFYMPQDVAVDSAGNFYVADFGNNRIVKHDSQGNYLMEFSAPIPFGLDVDSQGNIFVASGGIVRKYDAGGNLVTYYGDKLYNGEELFMRAKDVALDSEDNFYVADDQADKIYKFSPDGNLLLSWGGTGSGYGQFEAPRGIDVSPQGIVYVADTQNNRVQFFDSQGTFLGQRGYLNQPYSVASDDAGNIFVADTQNYRVMMFDKELSRIHEELGVERPWGIDADNQGNVYIVNNISNEVHKYSFYAVCGTGIKACDLGDVLITDYTLSAADPIVTEVGGLRIGNNVELDCANNELSGISAEGAKNITIRNCIVTDSYYGFFLNYVNGANLINNTAQAIYSDNMTGFEIQTSQNVTLQDNTSQSCRLGVELVNSQDITMTGNTLTDCQMGIMFNGLNSNATITNNKISDSGDYAVNMGPSTEIVFNYNDVYSTTGYTDYAVSVDNPDNDLTLNYWGTACPTGDPKITIAAPDVIVWHEFISPVLDAPIDASPNQVTLINIDGDDFASCNDCDDNDSSIGMASDGTCDGDNDGYFDSTAGGDDCNDNDEFISPATAPTVTINALENGGLGGSLSVDAQIVASYPYSGSVNLLGGSGGGSPFMCYNKCDEQGCGAECQNIDSGQTAFFNEHDMINMAGSYVFMYDMMTNEIGYVDLTQSTWTFTTLTGIQEIFWDRTPFMYNDYVFFIGCGNEGCGLHYFMPGDTTANWTGIDIGENAAVAADGLIYFDGCSESGCGVQSWDMVNAPVMVAMDGGVLKVSNDGQFMCYFKCDEQTGMCGAECRELASGRTEYIADDIGPYKMVGSTIFLEDWAQGGYLYVDLSQDTWTVTPFNGHIERDYPTFVYNDLLYFGGCNDYACGLISFDPTTGTSNLELNDFWFNYIVGDIIYTEGCSDQGCGLHTWDFVNPPQLLVPDTWNLRMPLGGGAGTLLELAFTDALPETIDLTVDEEGNPIELTEGETYTLQITANDITCQPEVLAEVDFNYAGETSMGFGGGECTAALTALQVDKHTVGAGSKPGSTKEGIANMTVKLFDKSTGSCAAGYGISWQNYPSIWANCTADATAKTDDLGYAELCADAGNYMVVGEYNDGLETIYPGVSVGEVVDGVLTEKYLQVIVKADGEKVPAKYKKLKGSELLIIEPEYVVWDSLEETYPIVFEAVGEWTTATSVSPPEGYVPDYDILAADPTNEIEAVQFTVVEVGSELGDTLVSHRITHNGQTEDVSSSIGFKATPAYYEAKAGKLPAGDLFQFFWRLLTGRTVLGMGSVPLGVLIAGVLAIAAYFWYYKPKQEGRATAFEYSSSTRKRRK